MAAYFDLQVNGYAGVDFNSDDLLCQDLVHAVERLQADEVESFFPTIITAPLAVMLARIERLVRYCHQTPSLGKTIAGLHLEGPFLSSVTGYVGAHPAKDTLAGDVEVAKRLIDAGQGMIRLLTLAPEVDPQARLVNWLSKQGIIVAAGHSDASRDELKRSIDAGLSMFTHLGNGCPGLLPRHDNIVQRVLSLAGQLTISFIADGHHIPLFALQNYLQRVPVANTIIVTDAISAAGLGRGRYRLGDQWVDVSDDGAAWSADRTHFAGSAATMPQMVGILKSIMIADDLIAAYTHDNAAGLVGSLTADARH